jgi:hypothetical protein
MRIAVSGRMGLGRGRYLCIFSICFLPNSIGVIDAIWALHFELDDLAPVQSGNDICNHILRPTSLRSIALPFEISRKLSKYLRCYFQA